jgi:hypothetical protein
LAASISASYSIVDELADTFVPPPGRGNGVVGERQIERRERRLRRDERWPPGGPATLTPGVAGGQGSLGRGATRRSADESDGVDRRSEALRTAA